MDEVASHITVHVDTKNSQVLVETREVETDEFDSYVFELPRDDEYWVSDDRGTGIEKATSYFHERRGEEWLIETVTGVTEAYPSISPPTDIAGVSWWRSG